MDMTASDIVEDQLLFKIEHGALLSVQGCDIVQFASLDDATIEPTMLQKFQARSLARRSSAEGNFHNSTGTLIFF